jgi:integrase
VPLSEPALAILGALPKVGEFVFANHRGRPLSKMAFEKVLEKQRPDVTTHGMRATFGTWCREVDETPADVREMALAHKERDRVAAAYNQATLLKQRRKLLEDWAAFATRL